MPCILRPTFNHGRSRRTLGCALGLSVRWIEEGGCDLPAFWGTTTSTSNTLTAEALSKLLHYIHAHLLPEGCSRRIWLFGHLMARVEEVPYALLCSLLCHPIPLQLVTVGCRRGMNQQAGFKNQSNPPFQGQTQVELHGVFSKRPPEPFCSSLLSPCSSQCTCERNN